MHRKSRIKRQELIEGACGINTRKEFSDKLQAVLDSALRGLRLLEIAKRSPMVDNFAGIPEVILVEELGKLENQVRSLFIRARKHCHSVRSAAEQSPNTPPDVWSARKGQAALMLTKGIMTCLKNAPQGVGRPIAAQLRTLLDESGAEAELTEAAAILLGKGNDVFE